MGGFPRDLSAIFEFFAVKVWILDDENQILERKRSQRKATKSVVKTRLDLTVSLELRRDY
jgi:hypothetical protein